TRQEKKTASGASTVYIFDPIDNRSYVLNSERRTAMRIPRVPVPPVPPIPPIPPVPRVPNMAPPAPPAAPSPTAGRKAVSSVESDSGRATARHGRTWDEDVRVEVVRIGDHDWPGPATPHALTLPLLPRGKGE